MSCSIGQLDQIAPGFDDFMAELNEGVKKGGGQCGGAPLNNRVAMQYLGCIAIAFMVLGGGFDASCYESIPNFAYILASLSALQNLFFSKIDIGRINLYHTIGSKIGTYLLAIQKDKKAWLEMDPEVWLPTPVFQLLTFVHNDKPVDKTDTSHSVAKVVQDLTKMNVQGNSKRILVDEPNVSLQGNVIKVRKCPATLTVTGGKKRRKSRKR